MSVPEFAKLPEDLPPPTAELVLFRVHVEALVATLGRRKALKYLRICSEIFATEESLAAVFPVRPASQWEELATARRHAAYWYRRALSTFNARVPLK